MKQIDVGIIGTGWCGGIRAETSAANPRVKNLRLVEVTKATGARIATTDYRELLKIDEIDAYYISGTPESLHYPIARKCLLAGKHVFLDKPIAIELHEADELIAIARKNQLRFTIRYSQRFNPKFAYVKKSITDGVLGKPVSALVGRHIGRSLGMKITGRTKLSPVAMEATHDLDFVLWFLNTREAGAGVFAGQLRRHEGGKRRRRPGHAVHHGHHAQRRIVRDLRRVEPASRLPQFRDDMDRVRGTEGALFIDDTHRDTMLTTMQKGIVHPMSTMPGERVDHTYAGPMVSETEHFLKPITCDRPVLVTAEGARQVMEVYITADISAERNQPVSLPLPESRGSSVAVGGTR